MGNSYLPIWESSCFAEEYKILEQEDLTQALLAFSLPDQELVLPQQSALFFYVYLQSDVITFCREIILKKKKKNPLAI